MTLFFLFQMHQILDITELKDFQLVGISDIANYASKIGMESMQDRKNFQKLVELFNVCYLIKIINFVFFLMCSGVKQQLLDHLMLHRRLRRVLVCFFF